MVRFGSSHFKLVLLVSIAGLVIWQAAAFADKPVPAPTPGEVPAPLAPEAIEEILRLRRALGVSDVLRGATTDGTTVSPDDQFREALQTLAGQPSPPAAAPAQRVRPQLVDSSPPVVERTYAADRAVERLPGRSSTDAANDDLLESCAADVVVVAALRDTSRLLDNRAHDLDEERRFDEATKLRQLAARVRKDARRIESTVMAHEASVTPKY